MNKTRTTLLLSVLALLLVATYAGLYWKGHDGREATNNAYVRADSVMVTTRVAGQIDKVLVEDNEVVKEGQILATLDDRDYQASLHSAQADLAAQRAAVGDLDANIERQQAVVQQSIAEVKSTQASLRYARNDAKRYRSLRMTNAASQQDKEKADEQQGIWEANLVQAQAAQRSAEKQIGVLEAQRVEALAEIERSRAALEQAELNTGYTVIRAPKDGIITQRSLRVGAYVQPGDSLLAIVPHKEAYVVANYLETQMAEMEPGQPVEMTLDSLPGTTFTGHVDSIAPASSSAFSAVASENATGNFTKITQRMPVKIVFNPNQPDFDKVRIGMSVIAHVTTQQQS
ncbi:HlyD family secretion protein [Cobetia amphilecti]|uniref:HlyD family secretion protein n=1 Tax=Cobetia amphilecti TaxID=1055104 RepID=UPI0033777244